MPSPTPTFLGLKGLFCQMPEMKLKRQGFYINCIWLNQSANNFITEWVKMVMFFEIYMLSYNIVLNCDFSSTGIFIFLLMTMTH